VCSRNLIRSILFSCVALSCLIPGAHAEPLFERPVGLEQDVEFWRRVFMEIDTNQAFLHDSRHLEVIYEVVQVPENATPSIRRRIADLARERFKKSLQRIAKSDRASLDITDQRVLDLWPEDITAAELKEAAKRIRFQGGLADRFLEGLQRSGAWKPHIKAELVTACGIVI
jgi:membrane-bound lytic murein transglycosylase D